ncbi:RNAse R [Thalassoporum mexicanum PCC 7367]|uniref:ribonuclease R family protein n=1 Tax=Thalassoporum mexicanum TaxID=3457544 RepID=UPI00029FAF65|nr:ribonuclease R family protein [Pseudanabaena sp. PCC 7367]AFY69894.1 RNAse R [Pseudanabaena sp. PCC 7367]
MEFSIAELLDSFSDGKLVAPKAVEKKLGISDEGVRMLQVTLDALEKVGILEKDKGRYRRVSEDGVVEGRLRCSSKGFCFAIQDEEGTEDIYIKESNLSNAWNGDRVLVRVTRDGMRKKSPEGEVRLIVDRANPTMLAKVKKVDAGYRAMPLDDRLLFEIDLTETDDIEDLGAAIDKLVHVEMVRYPLGKHLPLGKVVQILGSDPESTADVALVCCKHNLPLRFSEELRQAAADLPKSVRKSDHKDRQDLRKQFAVEIGNAAAISLTKLPAGWELGVHIQDVSAYIEADSPLDRLAKRRLRTIYLGKSLIPMLPEIEVFGQSERLTISLLLNLDQDGAIKGMEIQPSIVAVDHQIDYAKAQAILNNDVKTDGNLKALLENIMTVGELLRQQRPGGLTITLPDRCTESSIQEPDDGAQGIPVIPESMPVYGAVAEVMIRTNLEMASHLHRLALPSMLRVQNMPEMSKFEEKQRLLESMGAKIELEQPEVIRASDYQECLAKIAELDDHNSRDILKYLFLSVLRPGEYGTESGPNFGLALEGTPYIHVVNPRHRYSDILAQRLLHALFAEGRDRRSSRSKEGVDLRSSSCHGQISWSVLPTELERQIRSTIELLAPRISQKEDLAIKARNDLEGLQKAEYMQARTGQNFFGIITGVQSYGFFVEIESLLVEGLVHVSSLKDDWYEFPQTNNKNKNRQQTVLVGRRSGRQYSLGDRVEVQVKSVDYYRQQIDLVAIPPEGVVAENGAEPAKVEAATTELAATTDQSEE